jgi:transcriptional regulator PpsR
MGRIEGARGEMLGLDAQATAALVEAAADVALILDADGTVRDVAASAEAWTANAFRAWIGQPWESLVTSESRPKVREMLSLVGAGEPNARWRHINQLQPDGVEVPILFSLVRIAPDGRMVAIGRDLRPLAALQGRLMEAQQLMERDYSRLRRLENEYRTLFDLIRDPILIVRARDHVVMECNRAAGFFFGQDVASLKQTVFDQLIAPAAASATTMLLQQVSGSGRASETELTFANGQVRARTAVSCLRQESDTVFLVRIEPPNGLPSSPEDASVLEALRRVSDGLVITDSKGVIRHANPAFLDQIQAAHTGQIIGESLNRWLGRANTDLLVMINSLAQGGSVRLFSTQLISESGLSVPVELSGVSFTLGPETLLGFMVRDVNRRLESTPETSSPVGRSGADLAALVGRLPLKEIVGETVDLIEKLCIEAALRLTKNNRASAAEMLGLSRQSLYVKLRRFGIDGPDADADD